MARTLTVPANIIINGGTLTLSGTVANPLTVAASGATADIDNSGGTLAGNAIPNTTLGAGVVITERVLTIPAGVTTTVTGTTTIGGADTAHNVRIQSDTVGTIATLAIMGTRVLGQVTHPVDVSIQYWLAGGAASPKVAGGASATDFFKGGGGISLRVAGGDKTHEFVKTGGALSTNVAGGSRITVRETIKSGGAVSVRTAGGDKQREPTKTGGGRQGRTAGGAKVLAYYYGAGVHIWAPWANTTVLVNRPSRQITRTVVQSYVRNAGTAAVPATQVSKVNTVALRIQEVTEVVAVPLTKKVRLDLEVQ